MPGLACLAPCLFLAIIKERYEENFGYQYMCNSPAAPSPQSSISDPFSWAIMHSPRPILRLIRWCSIRRVLWWPEQPSSAKSFHLTHPMWLWYMRMPYSCSDAQGGSGNAKSSKKNARSTRLGELHIWGTPPLTRSFIMAENRQGELLTISKAIQARMWLCDSRCATLAVIALVTFMWPIWTREFNSNWIGHGPGYCTWTLGVYIKIKTPTNIPVVVEM